MATKKLTAKHSRKADRRRSQKMSTRVGGPRSGISTRKARPGTRRAARRRMDEGEATTTARPYRDFQREYRAALWL